MVCLVYAFSSGLGQASSQILEKPDKETRGYMDYLFAKPGSLTPLNLPDAWPTNIHRNPKNPSPANTKTKMATLGTESRHHGSLSSA